MTLFLSEADIRALLPMADLIGAMETALAAFSSAQVVQPVRAVAEISGTTFFGAMPAYVKEPAVLGAKLVAVIAANRQRGLPTHRATILLLENADGSVRCHKDLMQLLEVPPLAVIPQILTRADLAVQRRRRWFAISGMIACILLVLLAVHLFYQPLDVLWAITMRRVGWQT